MPLWGEMVSVPIGVTNPWTLVGQLCSFFSWFTWWMRPSPPGDVETVVGR